MTLNPNNPDHVALLAQIGVSFYRPTISLIHPDRCEHDNVAHEGADPSVGHMSAYVWCEDCEKDLSDDPDFNGEHDYFDDSDREYDSWKDAQYERDYLGWD